MNRIRICIFAVVVLLVACVAFGLGSRPQVKNAESSSFSAERVAEDIRNISRKHHSVAHPEERTEVRNYLVSRLEELGADTVMLFEYKALTGPEKKHVTYTFDATNILATFAPEKEAEQHTSLLLVAHYDSRYSQPFAKGDTVWSYGAADDGYGIGVILETVNLALKYREKWKQGVKVLFTDAEEVAMMGMKTMWKENREEFNDVGLMINIEARGPYGPALLFETSAGNEKLMDLYQSAAEYPFTYSLTTVVYKFMPNYTDFTIVKDEIPGLNFSTIADINHYHTHLDNFSNINKTSIQHYGSQVVPVVHEYLTGAQYSERNSLKSDSDTINFTLPALGLFNFSKAGYRALNIAIFILFIAVVAVDVFRRRVHVKKILSGAMKVMLSAIAALVAGELFAYVCSVVAGTQFKLFGVVQGIMFDNVAMMTAVAFMVVVVVFLYMRKRKQVLCGSADSLRAKSVTAVMTNATDKLYGTLLFMMFASAILLVTINENLMFFIPLFASALAMALCRLTKLRVWFLIAVALILLHALSLLYALSMALTIGAFGAVLMLALIDLLAIIPLVDMYLTGKK